LSFGNPNNKLKYNSKEEQRQEFGDGSGLEWLDYGARMYDNQTGRFFTQDRYAFAYYSLSPYGYTANNPIGYIDKNGDYITIDKYDDNGHIMLSLLYENGKAYWRVRDKDGNMRKGDEYKENDNFFTTAINDLKIISSFDKAGKMVNDLEISPQNLSIRENISFNGSYLKRIITFDPRGGSGDGVDFTSTDILAHELGHAWSFMVGVPSEMEGSVWNIGRDEIFAVRFENYVRAKLRQTKMRMIFNDYAMEPIFKKSSPEYFSQFEIPYRYGELLTEHIGGLRQIPGFPVMDNLRGKIHVLITHDERKHKIFSQSFD